MQTVGMPSALSIWAAIGGPWWRTGLEPALITFTRVNVYRSANGIDWTFQQTLWVSTVSSQPSVFGGILSDGKMYFCGRSAEIASPSGIYAGPWVASSADGATWTLYKGVTGQAPGTADAGFVQLVGTSAACLARNTNGTSYVSADFQNWTAGPFSTRIAYGFGKFWMTTRNGVDGLWESYDLTTWTPVSLFVGAPVASIFYAGNKLVLVQSQTIASGYGTRIWYSEDGFSWAESILPGGFEFDGQGASSCNLGFANNCWFLTQNFYIGGYPYVRALRSTTLSTWSNASSAAPPTGVYQSVSNTGPFLLLYSGTDNFAYLSP
jgi:hypothetical protein